MQSILENGVQDDICIVHAVTDCKCAYHEFLHPMILYRLNSQVYSLFFFKKKGTSSVSGRKHSKLALRCRQIKSIHGVLIRQNTHEPNMVSSMIFSASETTWDMFFVMG